MDDPVLTHYIGHIKAGLPSDGGARVDCSVNLKKPLSKSIVVSIKSSHKGAAFFPNGDTLTIPANSNSVKFVLETKKVSKNIRVLISGLSVDGILVAAHQDIRGA